MRAPEMNNQQRATELHFANRKSPVIEAVEALKEALKILREDMGSINMGDIYAPKPDLPHGGGHFNDAGPSLLNPIIDRNILRSSVIVIEPDLILPPFLK